MTLTEQTSQKNVNNKMKDIPVNEITILLCYAYYAYYYLIKYLYIKVF